MYAERLILETDVSVKLKQMPMLPANKQFEAIFLVIDEAHQTKNVVSHTLTSPVKPE